MLKLEVRADKGNQRVGPSCFDYVTQIGRLLFALSRNIMPLFLNLRETWGGRVGRPLHRTL
jgi:hypothetical protein